MNCAMTHGSHWFMDSDLFVDKHYHSTLIEKIETDILHALLAEFPAVPFDLMGFPESWQDNPFLRICQ